MPTSPDPRIGFFDHHASTWDQSSPPIDQVLARLDDLRPQLGLKAGMNVLEVGCGTGRVTAWLADVVHPGRVTAIDFSAEMLARARARGIEADYRLADICREDLGTGCYDMVFCMHAFPHFRDPVAAMQRMAAAMKPSGSLLILHLIGRERVNAIHSSAGGAIAEDHLPAPERWPAILDAAGLHAAEFIDRDDLFLLIFARPRP